MAKRRIKKPVRKKKSDYPGEMSFRKALGMNPTYYQEGGKLYYQEDTGDLPTTKYGTPEYEEAYRTGNLLVNGVKPLPEFKVTPEYKSLSDELKRAAIIGTKGAAELTGVPGAVRFARSPVQSLKGAGNTIVDLGLMAGAGLSPVGRFGQMNPMGGAQYAKQGTNPLTGQGSFRAEDVEGAFNTLDAASIATIAGAGLKAPLQQGAKRLAKSPVVDYAKEFGHSIKKGKLPTYESTYRWQPDIFPERLVEAGKTLTPLQQGLTGSWYTKYPHQLAFYMRSRPGAGNVNRIRLSDRQIANLESSMPDYAKGMSGKSGVNRVPTSNTSMPGELIVPELIRSKSVPMRFQINPIDYSPQSVADEITKRRSKLKNLLDNPDFLPGDIDRTIQNEVIEEHAKNIYIPMLKAQEQPILGIPRKYFPFKDGGSLPTAQVGKLYYQQDNSRLPLNTKYKVPTSNTQKGYTINQGYKPVAESTRVNTKVPTKNPLIDANVYYTNNPSNPVSPYIHSFLDYAGLVPGLGEPFDATNSLLYEYEGDRENALVSAAATIPYAGMYGPMSRQYKKLTNLGTQESVQEGLRDERGYKFGGKLYYQENTGQLPPSTGFNFSGYLNGNQGLIPDYNNIPTKSHISNILLKTPLPVVKPADKPKNKPKKSDILDLDNSLDYLVNTRGGTRDLWGNMADTIGYHESAYTMDPLQKQIGGGPGRGIFQFEAPSLVTAQNRYKRIAGELKLKTDPEILSAKSALELSPEQQYSLFLINLSESKAKLKDYADNKLPLVDLWLQGHKNKEAKGDRGSFRTSVQKAKKDSIKSGYSTLKEFGGKLYYQENIGELPIITKDPNDPRINEYNIRKRLYESNVYPPEGVTMYNYDEYKPDAYTLYTPRDTKKEEYLGYDSWALSRMNQGNSDFVDIDPNKRITPKIKPSKFYDAIIRKYIDDPINQNYIQNSFKNYVLDPNSNILSYTDRPDKSFLLDPESSAKVFNQGLFFDTSNKLCADGHCSNIVTPTFGVPIYDPPGRPVVYDNVGSISKEWGRNWKSTESGKGAPPRPGMNTSNTNTGNPDDFGYYYQIRFNDGKSKLLSPEEYEQYKTTKEYINHENIINAEKQRQQLLKDERRNRVVSRKQLGGSLPKAQVGKLRYARGGSLTSAQDTAQAANLNQDVVRKDQKKATVWEDIGAAAYAVGEGFVDTFSFGLTDELTDAGFKALQAGAGHDVNSDEAKRQAGIKGWGNVAGAVTGALVNPASAFSAGQEGLEGIGQGIQGINPSNQSLQAVGKGVEGLGNIQLPKGMESMEGMSKLFMARNGGRFRYGYRGGGQMLNQNMGLTEIDGPSHEQGGVTLPNSGGRPDVEVEGPETIYTPENYVMSEKMKASKEALEYAGITGKAASRLSGKSYADLSKSIKSKAGDKLRPADPLSKKMLDKEMKRLMMAHEYDREAKRMKDEAMRSQMMGGSNVVAETPEQRAGGYNMYPNAESIAFPGNGATSVVPTNNNDPIMVTGADGNQQMLTDEPIETEAPFIEEKMAQGGLWNVESEWEIIT